MELDWREVSVTVASPDTEGEKSILSRCSGRVKLGRMVAIMGPSGAGKSTLLSCLCQEIPHQGIVTYDGARFSPAIRQLIGLCEQEDVVPRFLTVEQFLLFYAQMRFGIKDARAMASINERLELVRLEGVADTQILSLPAGARKRLCIAKELLSEPKILICDEPTKGLDVSTTHQVMSILKEICHAGRTNVLSTMHRPTTKIFNHFHDFFLIRRGEMVFFGPATQVEHVFSSVGVQRLPSQSIAEHVIDFLAKDDQESGCLTTEMHAQFLARARRLCSALPQLGVPIAPDGICRYNASFRRQLHLLTCRFAVQASKELFTSALLVQHTLEMGIAALAFWQLGYSEADVRPRFALCNWIVGHWCTYGTQTHMFTWSFLRQQLKKDISSGVYSLPVVFLARVVMMLPFEMVWPTYWTIGMVCITNFCPTWHSSVLVILVTWVIHALYQASSLAAGACCSQFITVQCIVFLFLTYSLMWSGLWVDVNQLSGFLHYLQYGNPLWYGVTLLSYISLPDNAQFSCDEAFSNKYRCQNNIQGELVLFGAEARARHRVIGQMPAWLCIGVLSGLLIFWWIVGFLALQFSLQCDLDISCEDEDDAASRLAEDEQESSVLSFKTSWSSSSRESMCRDGSSCSEQRQQHRSSLL